VQAPSFTVFILAAFLWACAASAEPHPHEDLPTVRIGVLAYKGPEAVPEDWSSVTERLNAALPDHRFVLVDYDLAGLTKAVRDSTVDFVITNSGHYITLEYDYGASRIATLESPWAPDPARAIGSAIVVRADDGRIRSLADLAGKRVEAIGPDAFGGYQVAARELLRAGVNPESAFASLRFVGFPMQQIVKDVGTGRADAGIIGVCLLEEMIREGDARPDEFRVVAPRQPPGFPCQASSALYPNWPIATLRHTSRGLAKRVANALLTMPKTADGYSWGVPTDYRAVNDLFLELRIGPYAYLREWTFEGFVRRYWGWLLFALTALTGWMIHTVRAEHLVQIRTRALTAEQEERRRLEKEVCKRRAMLDHVSRLGMLGEMATTIAHELNQPLAAIGNFARGMILRMEGGRMQPAPLVEGANEILAQSERAAAIIRNIRAFAKTRTPERRAIDLRKPVAEAVSLFTGAYPGVAVEVRDQIGGAELPVLADPLQLEQVVLNLLKNALDAHQAAGRPEAPIALELSVTEKGYRVAVRDSGVGLAEEELARLFEPFFSTKEEGIGLGLAICMSIIEAHGGQLAAAGNDGAPGLTVHFTLPTVPSEDAP
jgi:two-component system sensor histidine kinase TtrS